MHSTHTHAALPAFGRSDTWRDRLAQRVDRWTTSPRLYRWALSWPLSRWVVRHRSARLFELMSGFVHTQVLLACVRLQLLETLLEAPRTVHELAEHTGLPRDALQRLLDSALAIRLVELRGGERYGLGVLGAPIAAHEGLRHMVEHNATLYDDLRDPLALLRNPQQAGMHAYWPYTPDQTTPAPAPTDSFARYSALMASSQRFVIEELLHAYPFAEHQRVLDVGGGLGGWLCALAQRHPQLQCDLFDLPPVAHLAGEHIARQGLSERIHTHGGSFTNDTLPTGADLATLVRVAHDHDDGTVLTLLRAIHRALPLGGSLLLAEPMAHSGTASTADPYFHFYLMAMGSGRLRTPEALSALMEQAGFTHVERVHNPMPLHAQLLVGRKSKCLP
jgi:demethylspheroidene O-methyltransferase